MCKSKKRKLKATQKNARITTGKKNTKVRRKSQRKKKRQKKINTKEPNVQKKTQNPVRMKRMKKWPNMIANLCSFENASTIS